MSSKEKAVELIEKFTEIDEMFIGSAKQCAIICVDEIINDYSNRLRNEEIDYLSNPNPVEYWQSIKTEIQTI